MSGSVVRGRCSPEVDQTPARSIETVGAELGKVAEVADPHDVGALHATAHQLKALNIKMTNQCPARCDLGHDDRPLGLRGHGVDAKVFRVNRGSAHDDSTPSWLVGDWDGIGLGGKPASARLAAASCRIRSSKSTR